MLEHGRGWMMSRAAYRTGLVLFKHGCEYSSLISPVGILNAFIFLLSGFKSLIGSVIFRSLFCMLGFPVFIFVGSIYQISAFFYDFPVGCEQSLVPRILELCLCSFFEHDCSPCQIFGAGYD